MPPTRKTAVKNVRGVSQRQRRVAEEFRHALAFVLEREGLQEPHLEGVVVTVTEVRISPDLRNATAYVLPLGGQHTTAVLDALKKQTPWLRHTAGQRMGLKYLPTLRFLPDDSFDHAHQLDALLKKPEVARDLRLNDAESAQGDA
jgi:ribosome-binding factor A